LQLDLGLRYKLATICSYCIAKTSEIGVTEVQSGGGSGASELDFWKGGSANPPRWRRTLLEPAPNLVPSLVMEQARAEDRGSVRIAKRAFNVFIFVLSDFVWRTSYCSTLVSTLASYSIRDSMQALLNTWRHLGIKYGS
jgi:hypothetical protein